MGTFTRPFLKSTKTLSNSTQTLKRSNKTPIRVMHPTERVYLQPLRLSKKWLPNCSRLSRTFQACRLPLCQTWKTWWAVWLRRRAKTTKGRTTRCWVSRSCFSMLTSKDCSKHAKTRRSPLKSLSWSCGASILIWIGSWTKLGKCATRSFRWQTKSSRETKMPTISPQAQNLTTSSTTER